MVHDSYIGLLWVLSLLLLFLILPGFNEVQKHIRSRSIIREQNEKLTSLIKDVKNNNIITLNDIADKVYVIAIPDRKTWIKGVMDSHNINFEFSEISKKDDISIPSLKKSGILTKEYEVNAKGKIACHLSHINACKAFLADPKAETCVIFEDDLRWCFDEDSFGKRLTLLKQELENLEWDLIYLGRCHDRCVNNYYISTQIAAGASPLCRHALLMNRKGATEIVNRTIPMYNNGDIMYRDIADKNHINSFVVSPGLFFQNRDVMGSTLENYNQHFECGDLQCDYSSFKANPFNKISVILPENLHSNIDHYRKMNITDDVFVEGEQSPSRRAVLLANGTLLTKKELIGLADQLLSRPLEEHYFNKNVMILNKLI